MSGRPALSLPNSCESRLLAVPVPCVCVCRRLHMWLPVVATFVGGVNGSFSCGLAASSVLSVTPLLLLLLCVSVLQSNCFWCLSWTSNPTPLSLSLSLPLSLSFCPALPCPVPRQRYQNPEQKVLLQGSDYVQQLEMIFELLGKPSKEDMHFITHLKARLFVESYRPCEGIPLHIKWSPHPLNPTPSHPHTLTPSTSPSPSP
jgi:hypothetical protein